MSTKDCQHDRQDSDRPPAAGQEGLDVPADAWHLWLSLVEQSARSARLEHRIAELQASRSWRITAPLRKAGEMLGRLRAMPPQRPRLTPSQGGPGPVSNGLPARLARVLQPGREAQPRLLVDVTELALEDLGAGVQRVTRRLLAELILSPPPGFRIEPVRLSADAGYVVARQFLGDFVGAPKGSLGCDSIVEPGAGDVFFGLDHCRDRGTELRVALRPLVGRGVPVTFLLHDVLPLTHPQWFPSTVSESFADWLGVLSEIPCKVISVSANSATELARVMRDRGLNSPSGGVVVITPGSDLPPTVPVSVLPQRDCDRPRVLMVGTIEPRKAHAQALAAFEELWSRGQDFELVLAGKPGWHVEDLVQRLREHPEQGHRLRWIENADDSVLASLYADCDLLLMASRGEGYGLPIAEAGRCGTDLLLRDLPVFREVAGESARYFEGDSGSDIARSLMAWREDRGAGSTSARSWAVWSQTADAIRLAIVSREAALDGHGASAGQENS